MKHVSEISREIAGHEWLVLGTGLSLDNFEQANHRDKKICCIHASIAAVEHCDLLFAPDYNIFKEVMGERSMLPDFMPPYKHLVTRAFNAKHPHPFNTLFYEYDCDVKSDTSDGTFHGGDGIRYFPNMKLFPCSCTSVAIIYLLGMCGIRRVYTIGMDGGDKISTRVAQGYHDLNRNEGSFFDSENEDMYNMAKNFNIEIIKLWH